MVLDKHHLILYGVTIIFALGLTYAIESKIADRADQKYQDLKTLSDQKDATNAQFQKQITDQMAQLAMQNSQLQAANVQQNELVSSLIGQLKANKTKDATLPPTDLATRIQTLAPGGNITVVSDGYHLDQAEAVAIAQELEEPPILNQQIASKDVTIKNDEQIIVNDAKTLDSEKRSHKSDVDAIQANLNTVNQEIKTVKADARKSKFKWFIAGVVAGFTLGRIHNLTF
jgi:hypothetical protein